MHHSRKEPVCYGWRTTKESSYGDELPTESLTDAEARRFKYCCVGHAMWQASHGARSDGAQAHSSAVPQRGAAVAQQSTQLPYCEGLEIVQSTQPQRSPVPLLGADGELPEGGAATDAAEPPVADGADPARPKVQRKQLWTDSMGDEDDDDGTTELDRFGVKFFDAAGRISGKMVVVGGQLLQALRNGFSPTPPDDKPR